MDPAAINYVLSRPYDKFRVHVGFNDDVRQRQTSADFRVYADGHLRAEAVQVTPADAPQEL